VGQAHAPIWAVRGHTGAPSLISYKEAYARHGFGYVASANGLLCAVVFSRGSFPRSSLEEFERRLLETLGLDFDGWTHMRGAVPRHVPQSSSGPVPQLAGTLAGMIDPFYLSGVAPALLSGGPAALAVVDPEHAAVELRQLTRTHALKSLLARVASRPLPLPVVLAFAGLNAAIGPVGGLRR